MKPVVLLAKDRPPSEIPPSSETTTSHIKNEQWVDGTITTAIKSLAQQDVHNATALSTSHYTPRIKKISANRVINQTILSHQRQMNVRRLNRTPLQCKLQLLIVYVIHIPTPKEQSRHKDTPSSNIINNTTWKDDPTYHWTLNEHGQWDTDHAHSILVQSPHTTPDNATSDTKRTPLGSTPVPPSKWGGAHLNRIKALPDGKIELGICTYPIQNNTGANQNMTNIQSIIHQYEDIDLYPIRGVKVNEV